MSTSPTPNDLTVDPERVLANVFVEHRGALRRRIASRLNRQIKGRIDPSDVVQETLAEACARIEEYLANPTVPLLQWLYALAEQNAIAAHRIHVVAQKRSTNREESLLEHSKDSRPSKTPISGLTDPGLRFEKKERMERLHQAICMLSPPTQTVVRMRFLEGRQLAEIAEALDISVDAVAKRALRGLVKLHEFAGELGLEDTRL